MKPGMNTFLFTSSSANESAKPARFFSALILAFCLAAPLALPGAEDDGFEQIFNGKDLTGWDGDPRFWAVRDGAITGQTTPENPTKGNTFIIWRDGKTEDFILRLQYRIVGGNSGIQYRSKDHGDWVVGGYQADFEAGDNYTGILYEERGTRGIMAARGEMAVWYPGGEKRVAGSLGDSEEIQKVVKDEDWNEYIVIARGNNLTHIINGRVTAIAIDNDPKLQALSGILAFQLHAGPPMLVQFKEIQLKQLPK